MFTFSEARKHNSARAKQAVVQQDDPAGDAIRAFEQRHPDGEIVVITRHAVSRMVHLTLETALPFQVHHGVPPQLNFRCKAALVVFEGFLQKEILSLDQYLRTQVGPDQQVQYHIEVAPV